MNKLVLWIMSLAVTGVVTAQTGPIVSIRGQVKDPKIKEVYLVYFASGGIRTDSAQVRDHTYTLTGQPERGLVATLTTAGPNELPTSDRTISLFLQPSEQVRIMHPMVFSDAVITGSPANTEYRKLIGVSKEGLADYMTANPSSPLLTFAFNNYIGDPRSLRTEDVPKVRSLFNMLPDSVRRLSNSQAFLQKLDNMQTFDKNVVVGQPAPDFTQNDTSGHPVKLSSFRGKYVLLDFWASWCGPCREDNPNVVKAYHKYHDRGFEILSVSLDQQEKAWKKAIRDDKLDWTHVSDLKYWNNALVKLYGVQGVPQNFLIDPQGRIVARSLRGEDLDKKLGEIYKN